MNEIIIDDVLEGIYSEESQAAAMKWILTGFHSILHHAATKEVEDPRAILWLVKRPKQGSCRVTSSHDTQGKKQL